jgi:S1-C subfamily serine protease
MIGFRWLLVVCCVVHGVSYAGESLTWTDGTGSYRVEAELVSADHTHVTLQKADGSRIRVPKEKLSANDRAYLAKLPLLGNQSELDENSTFDQLQQLMKEQRSAKVVQNLLEGFIDADSVADAEKQQAREQLENWRRLAAQDAIRVGNDWITPDDYQQMKDKERRLIKEAHRLIDIKNDELAKDKFLEASTANPQEVRADFYMGLLNALVSHYPPDAQRHFAECARRLARDSDLLVGTRKANLIAALNNLAIVQVRMAKYSQAISLWRRALQLEPFTPELVQNLGRMAKLAQLGEVRISKTIRDAASELYAVVTVQHSLARFDDKVGWLFIPYIDTVDGSMDSDGDEELVPVAWCTGFSIGENLLLTSRYTVSDADAVAVYGGGPRLSRLSGKVVSLSGGSNLAVVRIDGLQGKPLTLNRALPRPAQDVAILGYGQPGLAGGAIQSRTATILNPPLLYQRFAGVVHKKVDDNTSVSAPVYNTYAFRNKILHDAITNPGLEGSPLLDAKGNVVGVHIGNRPEFGRFGSKHSWAEPIEFVLSFLMAIGDDFDVCDEPASGSTPPSADQLANLGEDSIFQLVSQRRAPRLEWSHRIEELHRLQKQGSWTSYEDNTCMACNGKSKLECPVRLCARGKVPKKVKVEVTRNSVTGEPIYTHKTVREKCTRCNGSGFVDCPHCR